MLVLRASIPLLFAASQLIAQGKKPIPVIRPAIDPIDHAGVTYGGLTSLTAKFEESRTVRSTGLVIRKRGEIAWEAPNKYSVRYEGEHGDHIVFDGNVVWKHVRSTVPAMVLHGPEGTRPWVIGWWRILVIDARSKYSVDSRSGFGANASIVNMRPRDGGLFEAARLWVDDTDGLVRRLEIDLLNKSLLELRFSDIKLNPRIPARTFKFTVPKGVEVYPPIPCTTPGYEKTASTTPRC